MNQRISLMAVGHASSALLVISFVLCVGFDLLFPDLAMYRAWQDLLPGFSGLNVQSFVLGLVETYGYGWYATLIWVPIYNYVVARQARGARPSSPMVSSHVQH